MTDHLSRSASSFSDVPTKRLYDFLARYAGDIADFDRQARARRLERDTCIRELVRRGESERHVADVARIGGPAVHYVKEKGDA